MNLPPLPKPHRVNQAIYAEHEDLYTADQVRHAQREAVAGPDGWEANAQFLLDKCPYTVWQRPGAGPVDLLSTLVVTFSGMQMRLQGHPMFADENKSEAAAAAVPEGWKLVPIAPTPAMKAAGAYASMLGQDIAHHTYSKKIAAAPGGER